MSRQLDPNKTYIFDGTVRVDARAYFGLPNTDPRVVANRIKIFSDKEGTVEIPQPQQTDEQGVLPPIYINEQEYSFAVDTSPAESSQQIVYEAALEGLNSPGLVTADIDMNGFKHVNVAVATENNQYHTLGQAYGKFPQAVVVDALSTRNAIVADLPVNPSALLFGQPIRTYITHDENDSSVVTVKLGAFAAKQTYKGNNLPLDIGDTYGDGNFCDWLYDDTLDKFQLLNPSQLAQREADQIAAQLPVGSIYQNAVDGTNPATLLGYGTWSEYAEGRVMVGVGNTTDTRGENKNFAAGSEAGEFNHQLLTPEMPAHDHPLVDPGHSHNVQQGTGGGSDPTHYQQGPGVGVDQATSSEPTGITMGNRGSNTPHNNQQPYIATYAWVRTA